MFVHLDVGWLRHPFPVSSFRITSADQIETLRSLGLEQVRYEPGKSELPSAAETETEAEAEADSVVAPALTDAAHTTASQFVGLSEESRAPFLSPISPASPSLSRLLSAPLGEMTPERRLAAEQRRLICCDQRFASAAEQYHSVVQVAYQDAPSARAHCLALVTECVDDLQCNGESVIRLLTERVGERSGMHSVNVMVLC